ncbi:transaldolase [Sulfobacillus thermosulfidooxidans DSM 9293]|uniref:Transaldolase n=1 Tax=Sulfobacillus thermosulfidooxidans (strain DSM 9293 / VKM B-1269 / AT-1) TaxID=929705 RepID=A0A1W1WNV4_SULTA|nr:transaldolase family protein [Sulfobacillus thermosulfidooxidans]SMC07926.1 transaldolase [Sulfobacillus thermosulfidooxidans DSM 9293]
MKIFLDSANLQDIKMWFPTGVIDGVTTNPTIMLRQGVRNIRERIAEIADYIAPFPLSAEVLSDDQEDIVRQGLSLSEIATNVVVKVPIVDRAGVPSLVAIKRLSDKGVTVNCTACLTFNQAVLATRAGASYVSIMVGRIADEGQPGEEVVRCLRNWLDRWELKTKIISASIRSLIDIQRVAVSGSDIITIPPDLLAKMADHKYTRHTVEQFLNDGAGLNEGAY